MGRRVFHAALGLGLALAVAGCGAEAPAPSVLLVTLDTTRVDRLGAYGRADAGTPHLDALAARGALFERAYTTAPVTLPAHASIFTGTYPVWHGVHDNGSFLLDDALDTLAEALGAEGWRTGAFVAAYPVARGFGLEQGFEVYDDAFGFHREDRRFSRPERRAEEVVDAALGWLEGLDPDERFFSWVHVFDPHAPFEAPPPFDAEYGDPYQAEIAYTDHALGALFAGLERAGRLDSTVVVVVADHGEGLGDHGEETHGALIYDTTMRVPLIVAGPGVPAGVRVPDVVRVIDVLPTITDLANVATPGGVQGRSLVPVWRGEDEPPRTAYLETYWPRLQHGWSEMRGVVDGEWKIVTAPSAADAEPGLYDVVADPQEQDDLSADAPDALRELRVTLERQRETHAADVPFAAARGLSAEEEEKLRALGYVGSADPGGADRDPREMVEVLYGYVRAANHIRAGELTAALRVLDEVERLDPDSLGLHEHRGMVYQDMARRGEARALPLAIESYRRALAINDRREDIWMSLGETYRAAGDFAAAVEAYERSMAIATPSADAEVNYAGLLANTGRLDDAIARLEAFLDREPDFVRAHLTRAMLLAADGRNDDALDAFDRTVTLAGPDAPERLTAHKLGGLLAVRLGRLDDARRHLEAAARLDPADPDVRAALDRLAPGV